jgi:putative two-component system response regulator
VTFSATCQEASGLWRPSFGDDLSLLRKRKNTCGEKQRMEKKILIVDDEETICSLLAQRLGKEGYSCVSAPDVRKAIQLFYEDHFAMIISDILLPGMTGMDLLKQVRAIDPKVIVIMMTAFPEIGMAVEAIRLGAYDFIIKPVDLDLVTLSVRKGMERIRLEEEIEAYQLHLERLVEERTAELQRAYRVLKKAHLDSVKILAEAIDAKDPYTRGHSDRVRKMSVKIGRHLGFSEQRLESLEYGALLHDIGKIGIRDEILQKQSFLSPEEHQYIQVHSLIGASIVEGIDFFKDKIPIIRHHHEYYDGCGYPDGLAGEEIPLEARIIAVTDAFDAMTSVRPHRAIMPIEDVLGELEEGKGKQFDPEITDIFLKEKIYLP